MDSLIHTCIRFRFFSSSSLSRSIGTAKMVVSPASAVHLQACGRYLPLMLANERPKWSYHSSSHSAHYTSGRTTAKWRPWLFWEQLGSLFNVPHPSLQHESFFFSSSAVTPSINSINCLLFPFWPQNGQKVLIRVQIWTTGTRFRIWTS